MGIFQGYGGCLGQSFNGILNGMADIDVFTQLSLVLVVATVIALVMRLLRQPMIMAYILTGIIAGPSVLHIIQGKGAFDTFSEIGITLLLFIIGLELSMAVVRRLGKPVFITAFALLLTIGTIGYLVGTAFHFNIEEAILVGLSLFFSSTIIIAKVLSDKKELSRLNGQLAIGVILIDDIVATFALLFIATQTGNSLDPLDIALLVVKGAGVLLVLLLLGAKVLPWLTKKIARSQELLFVFALAWGFGIATLVNYLGFSIEIGALFAGITLAHLPYVHEIGARLKPLRDFFIILFFISLGESFNLTHIGEVIVPAIVLSLIVMVVKPFAVMTTLGLLGYTKRTSFKTGINLSQISEFSIIMIVLASTAGLISPNISAIITLVAIITITISTYLMQYDNWIYDRLERHLHLFERKSGLKDEKHRAKEYSLVLFGYRNGGQQFLRTFRAMRKSFVVVDYDPEVIEDLDRLHVNYLYGDATDQELLSEIDIDKAKLIVNAIGDHAINVSLVNYIRRHNDEAVVVCYSNDYNQAAKLYDLGATYVFLPQYIGSEKLSGFIAKHGLDKQHFDKERERHVSEIRKMLETTS